MHLRNLLVITVCSWGLAAAAGAQSGGAPCVGDCALDGSVTVDEIVVGVSIALGQSGVDRCVMFDRSRDGAVTVDEILAAVSAALGGCAPNRAPLAEDLPDYVTYPEQEVHIILPGMDPDDDTIDFGATDLPPGATLDSATGVLAWQPTAADVGAYFIAYTVTDDGLPSLAASGSVRLDVLAANSCLALECDPATGCTSMPLDVSSDCCQVSPAARVSEPLLDCPEGALVEIGRNTVGFGPMRDCDEFPLQSQGQGGTRTTMHIAARCIRPDGNIQTRVQLFIAGTVLINIRQTLPKLDPAENDFFVTRNRAFSIDDSTVEPALFDGREAQLSVSVQDADGLFVERTIRVVLTCPLAQPSGCRGSPDDLPDENSPSLPPASE